MFKYDNLTETFCFVADRSRLAPGPVLSNL